MKVRVDFDIPGHSVHEIVEGHNSDALLAQAKSRAMHALGWKGLFLAPISPLELAKIAVRHYNERFQTDFAIPVTADDFIEFGKQTGAVTILNAGV